MPTARLIDVPTAPPRTRRSGALEQERDRMRDLFRQAHSTGRAIELALGPEERDKTIKGRYRALAREIGCTIRFRTARRRPFRSRRGKEMDEAAVLLAFVTQDADGSRLAQVGTQGRVVAEVDQGIQGGMTLAARG